MNETTKYSADIDNLEDGWVQVTISGNDAHNLTEHDIERALSALHAKAGAGVKVKELEWEVWFSGQGREYAKTPIGETYHVSNDGWWHPLESLNSCNNLEAAKAAAQADYDARIRSALSATQEPVGYVAKCDLASLTDPEQGLCVNIWRHEQSDGDVPLYTSPILAHQPVTAGLEGALEPLLKEMRDRFPEEDGQGYNSHWLFFDDLAYRIEAALKSEGRK